MEVFAKSDIGKVREINQDSYFIAEEENNLPLYIIGDGMGGYTGGEIASKLAVSCVKEYMKAHLLEEYNDEEIKKVIENAILYANDMICKKANEVEELEEMGTTLDVCLVLHNKLYIGHIGDSRVYRIRNQEIKKLTTDHSYVETLVQDGTITREEAATHPKKNMLIKALGGNTIPEPDVFVEDFQQGDTILMCTDGLTNMLKEDEICSIMVRGITCIDSLIQRANELGGYDNITVVIIQNN